MTKPSAKWCASIALLSLLGAEPAPAGDSAAAGRDAAGEVLSRFWTSEGLRRHTAEPLTAGGTLQTIDGGLTGSAYLTQPSSTAFLTVLVQPGPTGDLILVQASQDLDFSGTADYAFEVPAPVSGVCANGIISCTPGSWLDCEPYRWVAAGTGRVSLESTVLGNLGGCYCINHSCGSGLAWTNLPLILKDLGGGIAGAVQQQKAGYVITHTEIDGPAITYYGQDTSSSGSGGAVPAANHYQSPALLTAAAEDAAMIQAADPDSHYSMIRTSFALRGADQEIRTCSITRVIEAGGPQCSDGVYNASAGKCEVPDWNDGSSYGAVFGFEVEEGKIRIVYRPTSLYGNWAALGTGSQKSTVTYYSYTECYYCDSNGTVCDTDYRNMSIETHGGTDFRIVQEGSSWSRATPWFTIGVDNDGFGHQRINYSSNWIGLSVSGNSLRLHDTWSGNIYAGAWVAIGFYCPNGGTLSGTDCVISVTHDPTCPEGSSFDPDNNVCQAVLSCSEGTYRSDLKACYVGHITCPLGDHPCAVIDGSGVNKCSALACVDASDSVNMEDAESDLTAYEDDGSIDPDTGECSGVFKIFNGRPGECLPSGVKTWFFNCCNPNPSSWLIFQKSCPDSSLTTAQAIQAQTTHYIGTYCKTRIPIIGCIQRARVYCIFNSKLARIVHQQGREQLHKFAPDGRWGSAQSPNCEGFTPEEFQVLDFSKIDLGEFFGDIDPLDTPALQQKTQDAIINFQDSLR